MKKCPICGSCFEEPFINYRDVEKYYKEPERFRKKPVVVEAYQTDKEMIINTLEGKMKANIGDWVITGVNGEQYPCKPDVFEKTYEPVIEGEQE